MLYRNISLFIIIMPVFCVQAKQECESLVLEGLMNQSRLAKNRPVDIVRLRKMGLKDAYIAGLDKLDKMFEVSELLRSPRFNPTETHVEHFASLIPHHLAVIESGLPSQEGLLNWRHLWDWNLGRRLAISEEAEERLETQRVTYNWWVSYHLRFSILATLAQQMRDSGDFMHTRYRTENWHTNEKLKSAYQIYQSNNKEIQLAYLNKFPKIILWPTVDKVGVDPFNRLFMTGMHPVGVRSTPVVADGITMSPLYFFLHDFVHLINIVQWEMSLFATKGKNVARRILHFHNEFINRTDTLPKEEMEMAKLMYFLATYDYLETGERFATVALSEPSSSVRRGASTILEGSTKRPMTDDRLFSDYLLTAIASKLKGSPVLPEGIDSNSTEEIANYLFKALEVFNTVALEIRAENADILPLGQTGL